MLEASAMPARKLGRACAILFCGWLAAASLAAEDGWSGLTAARAELERAAWTADFVQTYVPAGFSSGERETGRLALALPGRLRWDYSLPYPKVFLIRGAEAYTWNPGETTGRRALLEATEREHLALLELDIESLRGRYDATVDSRTSERLEITLTPRDTGADMGVDIQSATVVLDPASHRILTLSYSDLEGSTTRFELSGHRIAAQSGLFDPPAGLDWLDD